MPPPPSKPVLAFTATTITSFFPGTPARALFPSPPMIVSVVPIAAPEASNHLPFRITPTYLSLSLLGVPNKLSGLLQHRKLLENSRKICPQHQHRKMDQYTFARFWVLFGSSGATPARMSLIQGRGMSFSGGRSRSPSFRPTHAGAGLPGQ